AADDGSGFGLAVALQQGDPERQKKPADLGVERGAARDHRFEAPAEALADFGADDPVEQWVDEPLAQARALRAQPLAPDCNRLIKHLPRDAAFALDPDADP